MRCRLVTTAHSAIYAWTRIRRRKVAAGIVPHGETAHIRTVTRRRFMKNIRIAVMRYVALALAIVPVATGNVVTDWNAIASTTIVKNGGKGPGAATVWFSYASLAVYDAVNAITGQYRPFYYHGTGSRNASIDAAAADRKSVV